jgi:predicted MFS family arabinose efflux permease
MALAFLGSLFAGMRVTASNSLTLEQVPRFRGTMMSISTAADNAGSSIGASVGGLALILFNYEGMALSLGAMGIASAIVFQLLAIDPTKTEARTGS